MKTRCIVAVFILAALLSMLSGCRYRIYFYDAEIYAPEVIETVYELPVAAEEPPTPTPTPQPSEPLPDIEPDEVITDIPQEIITETHIEAVTDELSPQTFETASDDARQYAFEQGYSGETEAGVEEEFEADNIITIEELTDDYGQAAIGDDGGVLGVLAVYSTLLRQGVNTMFPCQLLYVFVETADDLVTAARGTPIYQMVIDAGGLNVSSRLPADRLEVTADWVVRRNPDVIVKFVGETVLGREITDTYAAAEVKYSITSRQNWNTTEAARNGRILLLSEQLLETDETKLAAKLAIAYMMYPELFAGFSVGSVINDLTGGMGGVLMLFL